MTAETAIGHGRPAYARIADILIERIAAGHFADGERLPPERELAKSLAVSVGTLRKALDQLEKQSLLKRVQGSGNYVSGSGLRSSVYSMFRLELKSGGGLPSAEVISVDVMEKPDELPAFGSADTGTRIRRLRKLSGTPIALEEIWLDASVGTLEPEMIGEALYQTYRSELGVWITHAEDRVAIAPLPEWARDVPGFSDTSPTGFIERYSWQDASVPIEFSRTWFDTETSVYVQRIA